MVVTEIDARKVGPGLCAGMTTSPWDFSPHHQRAMDFSARHRANAALYGEAQPIDATLSRSGNGGDADVGGVVKTENGRQKKLRFDVGTLVGLA